MVAKVNMVAKHPRGLETELKILKQFALNKEVYQYNLNKKVGVSYRTVLRTLHSLEKSGQLKIVRKEESEKQGKERNVWGITLQGLLNLLSLDTPPFETRKKIGLIAEVHQDKLLVFKKWKFFEKENLTPTIIKTLQGTLLSLVQAQLRVATFSMKIESTKKELQEVVDSMTLGCYALRALKWFKREGKRLFEEYLKILKACKKDEELRNFVVSELNFFKRIAEESLTSIEQADKLFASL